MKFYIRNISVKDDGAKKYLLHSFQIFFNPSPGFPRSLCDRKAFIHALNKLEKLVIVISYEFYSKGTRRMKTTDKGTRL